MTWAMFKKALEAQGVKDEDEIAFIDYSVYAEESSKPVVIRDERDGSITVL